jgi:hypothetical protein
MQSLAEILMRHLPGVTVRAEPEPRTAPKGVSNLEVADDEDLG